MKTPLIVLPLLFIALLGLLLWHPWREDEPIQTAVLQADAPDPAPGEAPYRHGPASADGIGRFHLGREIARPGPPSASPPPAARDLIAPLELPSDARVALFAGDPFALQLAGSLPDGRVICVFLDPRDASRLETEALAHGTNNLGPQLAEPDHAGLPPESVDAVLLIESYHELSHPREMLVSLVESLRPGGQVALVENRPDDLQPMVSPLEAISEDQARLELESVGLEWRETLQPLPGRHLMVFRKARLP